MSKKITIEEFIERANSIHKYKYDYSKSVITNMRNKVDILCKRHGIFSQNAFSHLKGHGCSKCKQEILSTIFKSNSNEFIAKAIKIHKNKFSYENVNYILASKKVSIFCKIHGNFLQSPNKHLQGKGCPKCAGKNKNTKDFIKESNEIHHNCYDYSLTIYDSAKEKVKIICPKHGIFEQTPDSHLRGKSCIKCNHTISKQETEFLNYFNITNRNIRLKEWKTKPVDGFDPKTNTIYEFLGDYWHGNPIKYNSKDLNSVNKKTFGFLFKNTFKNLRRLKKYGYNVKYIWESDWLNFKNKIDNSPNIISL